MIDDMREVKMSDIASLPIVGRQHAQEGRNPTFDDSVKFVVINNVVSDVVETNGSREYRKQAIVVNNTL
jgi:hypothetical protein